MNPEIHGPLVKGPTRKLLKGRKDRAEAKVKKAVRALCVERDGRCRLGQAEWEPWHGDDQLGFGWQRHRCDGSSQWAHFGETRRARTRGQAPERRHTTAGSLMLCDRAHDDYDEGRLLITALTEKGCNGALQFRRAK